MALFLPMPSPAAAGSSAIAGAMCKFYMGATGVEVRTVAESGTTINDVDSDGTSEAAIPATHYFEVIKATSTNYLLRSWTSAGAAATVTPD